MKIRKGATRRCRRKCDCICHDTGGSGHDHPSEPCPGKTRIVRYTGGSMPMSEIERRGLIIK